MPNRGRTDARKNRKKPTSKCQKSVQINQIPITSSKCSSMGSQRTISASPVPAGRKTPTPVSRRSGSAQASAPTDPHHSPEHPPNTVTTLQRGVARSSRRRRRNQTKRGEGSRSRLPATDRNPEGEKNSSRPLPIYPSSPPRLRPQNSDDSTQPGMLTIGAQGSRAMWSPAGSATERTTTAQATRKPVSQATLQAGPVQASHSPGDNDTARPTNARQQRTDGSYRS